jgi:hypothetical protein
VADPLYLGSDTGKHDGSGHDSSGPPDLTLFLEPTRCTVDSMPAGIDCGQPLADGGAGPMCTGMFAPGTMITLTVVSHDGNCFGGWTGPCAAAPSTACTFTLTADSVISVEFSKD